MANKKKESFWANNENNELVIYTIIWGLLSQVLLLIYHIQNLFHWICIVGIGALIIRFVLKSIQSQLPSYPSPQRVYIKRIFIVLTFFVLAFITYFYLHNFNYGNRGELAVVDRIIDGDTFESLDKTVYRLIGINTPERGEYGYEEATKFLSSIIWTNCKWHMSEKSPWREVRVHTDGKGRYGRTLAYVSCNGGSINEKMIVEGYAVSYRKYPHKETKRYNELEAEAKRYNKGLWRYWNKF